MMDDGTKPAYR